MAEDLSWPPNTCTMWFCLYLSPFPVLTLLLDSLVLLSLCVLALSATPSIEMIPFHPTLAPSSTTHQNPGHTLTSIPNHHCHHHHRHLMFEQDFTVYKMFSHAFSQLSLTKSLQLRRVNIYYSFDQCVNRSEKVNCQLICHCFGGFSLYFSCLPSYSSSYQDYFYSDHTFHSMF